MIDKIDRLFVDASYVVALFNRRDQYHAVVDKLRPTVATSRQMWTTDAVLLEIGSIFAEPRTRAYAIRSWELFHSDNPRYQSLTASSELLSRAMNLFQNRPDKSWSLVDCTSFIAMEELGIRDALTADHHFVQAGFRALMLED